MRGRDDGLPEPDVDSTPLDRVAEFLGVGEILILLVQRPAGRELNVQVRLLGHQTTRHFLVGLGREDQPERLDGARLVARLLEHLPELVRGILVEPQEVGVRRRASLVLLEEVVVELLRLVHVAGRVVPLRQRQADRLRLRIIRPHGLDQLLSVRELAAGDQDLCLDQLRPILLVRMQPENLLNDLVGVVREPKLDQSLGKREVVIQVVGTN